jgi:hypothetical protein
MFASDGSGHSLLVKGKYCTKGIEKFFPGAILILDGLSNSYSVTTK